MNPVEARGKRGHVSSCFPAPYLVKRYGLKAPEKKPKWCVHSYGLCWKDFEGFLEDRS